MAGSLIESMAGEFHPDEFTDSYREALQQVIDAKVEGKEVVTIAEPEAEPGEVIDLMAALRASVEQARAARNGTTNRRALSGRPGAAQEAEGPRRERRPSPRRPLEGRTREGGEEGLREEGCVMSRPSGSLAA